MCKVLNLFWIMQMKDLAITEMVPDPHLGHMKIIIYMTYRGTPPYVDFETWKKSTLHEIHVSGTVRGPLLTQ